MTMRRLGYLGYRNGIYRSYSGSETSNLQRALEEGAFYPYEWAVVESLPGWKVVEIHITIEATEPEEADE